MKHGKPITLNVLNDQEIASGMRPPPGVPNRIVIPPDSRGVMLTLVTALFLHAGWVHLLTNMWFLWLFGNSVEDRLGHLPFLALYLAGGVAATACHVLMLPPNMAHVAPLVGASGAVAVILGANAVTYPFARIEALLFLVIIFFVVEIPAILVLGFWFLMQMAYAANGNAAMDGIAWWAHIGGFALGAMVMPLLTRWIPAQPAVPQVGSAVASPDLDDLSAER